MLIYTIGFGTPEGEPVPETNQYGEITGYKQDENGNVVLSRLDEATLQTIAQTTDGKYYRAAADGRELDACWARSTTCSARSCRAALRRPISSASSFSWPWPSARCCWPN